MEKNNILEQLRIVSRTWDNDYDVLEWLNTNKEELNKMGIWKKEEDYDTSTSITEKMGGISEMTEDLKKDLGI